MGIDTARGFDGYRANLVQASGWRVPAFGDRVVSPLGTVREALHWRQRYRRRLLITDIAVITLAISLPVVFGVGGAGSVFVDEVNLATSFGLAAFVGVAWILALQLVHSRAAGYIAVGTYEFRAVIGGTAAVAGALSLIAVIGGDMGLRGFIVASLPAGLVGLFLGRWGWRAWLQSQRKRGHALSDVVIYGQAKDTSYVVRQISRKSGAAYRVVGVVLDGEADPDAEARIRAASPGVPLIRGSSGLEEDVGRLGADAVVIAGSLPGGNRAIQELGWRLEDARTEVILVPSLTNVASPRIRLRPVEGLPLLHVELPTFSGYRHVVKRGMDIAVSLAALIVLAPLFLLIAVLVATGSPGGVIFRQVRTGRRGRNFTMYKFRSMVATAERDLEALTQKNEGAGPLFKLKNDPRVTPVGAWLRKYSLDEFPQFYNVLKGDMSLVGPRPPLPSEVATYEGSTHRRLYIKPGLTGLWQINGRSDLDWEESVRLDLYYVENWSVAGDLAIMWRTFRVMITPSGAY
ncbi:sugar transferase [Flaviflexus huanghaiensis]|uniref:sugar transferase n=1 Tax=Flaviflexus huanghaiensis TaxID=1111473 RepID=UPI0015FA1035|nr:sugar transferase [Flaviflexus huanghaiensis]